MIVPRTPASAADRIYCCTFVRQSQSKSVLGIAWWNRHAYDAADPIGHLRDKRHVNRTGWTADAAANAQTVNPNGVYTDRRFP